jgi:hypothetical protein
MNRTTSTMITMRTSVPTPMNMGYSSGIYGGLKTVSQAGGAGSLAERA